MRRRKLSPLLVRKYSYAPVRIAPWRTIRLFRLSAVRPILSGCPDRLSAYDAA